MNKYKNSYNGICEAIDFMTKNPSKIDELSSTKLICNLANIEELVNKVTPIKLKGGFICTCGRAIVMSFNYCPDCGQSVLKFVSPNPFEMSKIWIDKNYD